MKTPNQLGIATLGACLIGCSSPQDNRLWSPLATDNRTGEVLKWADGSQVETHLASMPGGDACREKVLLLLDEVETDWNLVRSQNSPSFTSDSEERHQNLSFHTEQGGPIWGKGVRGGEIVVFSATKDQIEYAAGARTRGFHAPSRYGSEITGGYIAIRDQETIAYCDGSDTITLRELIAHELGHVLGLGHAGGSELMNPSIKTKKGYAAKPSIKTEGVGLQALYGG